MCLDTVKQVLFEPKKFFNSLAKRKHYNLGDALRFLLTVGVFYVVMSLLVQLVFSALGLTVQGLFGSKADKMFLPFNAGLRFGFALINAVFSYAGVIVSSFVSALVIWLWIMLWGGKGDYQKAYTFSVYTMTPWLVLGWMPIANMFAGLWQLILMIFATTVLYKLSTTRAAVMWILPIVLLILAFLMLAVFFGSLFLLLIGSQFSAVQ